MTCGRCGAPTRFKPELPPLPGVLALSIRSHADAELWAYHCAACGRSFCGTCAFPEWQALKRKKGLSGPELAGNLDDDPGAVFGEQPTCPSCKAVLDEREPAPVAPKKPGPGCLILFILVVLAAWFWHVSRDRIKPPEPPPAANR